MAVNLHGRSLLTLLDLFSLEIDYLLSLAKDLKEQKRLGIMGNALSGKSIVLIFNKPSTRTRCAFETAVFSEAGQVTFLSNSHMGYKESIEDTAKILGRYYDGIAFRGYVHSDIECLANYSGIPVWNALTNQYHPTQVLADLMTIQEQVYKPLHKVKLVYVGDGRNNMAHSLMIGAAKMGMHFINLAPKALWPHSNFMETIADISSISHAIIECSDNIEVVINADVIYTDVWVSMGEETEWKSRINLLKKFQVTQSLLEKTLNEEVIFMHCLPAFHDTKSIVAKEINQQAGLMSMEVTDDVFRSDRSRVFEQAENRLHTIKAVILATIGNI